MGGWGIPLDTPPPRSGYLFPSIHLLVGIFRQHTPWERGGDKSGDKFSCGVSPLVQQVEQTGADFKHNLLVFSKTLDGFFPNPQSSSISVDFSLKVTLLHRATL